MTVRQIFDRLLGAPGDDDGYGKTEPDYERLAETNGKARRAGLIRFDAIRDDGAVRSDPVRLLPGYATSCDNRRARPIAISSTVRSVSRHPPSWPARSETSLLPFGVGPHA